MSTITCGEALVHLLEQYDVDTVFGIPGVHTLDIYRGLAHSNIRHVLARNEQGAGFMADGYARVSGKPGVCVLITGPGVTNATTPLGQAYADSVPMLLISSTNDRRSLGKGWGRLHEITDQQAVTAPLTAMSATALAPDDVPELLGQAFSIFASRRPRPVHISIPIDVLAMPVSDTWRAHHLPARPSPNREAMQNAAELLAHAKQPTLLLGGGALGAGDALTQIAELLNAAVITSNAAKGIVPDSHPLNLGTTICRTPTQTYLAEADVVLAIGTELSETDTFIPRLTINGQLIRVDLDPGKINDLYPADVGMVADASQSAHMLLSILQEMEITPSRPDITEILAAIRQESHTPLSALEAQHRKVLNAIRCALPQKSVLMSDMSQIVYTGCFAYQTDQPASWCYPAGYCTLGCALPQAIGAKLAAPDYPIAVLVGDGGFMFTVQELMVAAELQLPLPVIIWNNTSLGQIRDDMISRDIPPVGVSPAAPDFMMLAQAFGCHGVQPTSLAGITNAIEEALQADKPTIIDIRQDAPYLRS